MKNILAILTAALAVCVCTVEGYARGGIINIITYGGEVCVESLIFRASSMEISKNRLASRVVFV